MLVGGGLVIRFIGSNVTTRMEPRSTEDPVVRTLAVAGQYEHAWRMLQQRPSSYTSLSIPELDRDPFEKPKPNEPLLRMASYDYRNGRSESRHKISISVREYSAAAGASQAQPLEYEEKVTPNSPRRRKSGCVQDTVIRQRVGSTVGTVSQSCTSDKGESLAPTVELLRELIDTVHREPVPATYLAAAGEHPIMSGRSPLKRLSKSDEQSDIAGRTDGLDSQMLLRESVQDTGVQIAFDGRSHVYVYADARAARAAFAKQATWVEDSGPRKGRVPQPCQVRYADESVCRTFSDHGRESTVRWHAVGRYLVMDQQDEHESARPYNKQLKWLAQA